MKKKTILIVLISVLMLLCPAAVFAENDSGNTQGGPEASQDEPTVKKGWNEDRTIYYDENGNPTVGLFKAPMKNHTINALYYANKNGKVRTKAGIVTVNGDQKRFLYNSVNGDSGFDEVPATDKNTYVYFISNDDDDYRIVSKSGLYSTETATYFVLDNGTVKRDEGFADLNGKRYYVQESGCVKTKPGWIRYKDKKYRVGKNGVVRTKVGAFTVDGERYVIKAEKGPVCSKRGAVRANGKLYFVKNSKGVLGSDNTYRVGDKVYHVNKYGVVSVGRHKWRNRYYYSISKGYLKRTEGMVTKDGKRFYVKKGGLIVVNQKFKHNKWFYIAGKTGTIKTGLFKWKNVLYYASDKGALKRYPGIVQVGKYSYYVAAGGRVYVNQKFWSKGKLYVADAEGHLQSGFFKWGSYDYYANSDFSVNNNEIFTVNGKKYIADTDGHLKKGKFKWKGYYYCTDDNHVVYVDKKIIRNGSMYIADKNGHLMSGKFSWEGYTYYANSYCRIYVNRKFTENGNTYVANSKGHLLSGFFKWGGYSYYADATYIIYVHKSFRIGDKIYMTGTTGHLKKGVFLWYGNYYYSYSNYVLDTEEEIIKYDGKYYFNKDGGGLAKNEWVKVDDTYYNAGKDAAFKTETFEYNGVSITPGSDGSVSEDDYNRALQGEE